MRRSAGDRAVPVAPDPQPGTTPGPHTAIDIDTARPTDRSTAS